MKIYLLLTLILLNNIRSASCYGIFNVMSEKAHEFGSKIRNAFEHIKNKVKIFIFPHDDIYLRRSYELNGKSENKCDFEEKEVSKIDTNFSENDDLRLEPTALLSTPQLVALHGLRIESHTVLTKDGYFLTIHRLRPSFSKPENEAGKMLNYTILLHHGLLGSSADWILLGPEKSLPYLLLNAGCDVWLANARGNYYSKGHISKNVDSLDYWSFSFEEMGKYDLPAVVEYITTLKNTDEKITFIGHSMGATAFLVMLSSLPNYNNYFRMAVLLAPLVYLANIEGPLKILTNLVKKSEAHLLRHLGEGEFIPSRKVPTWIANKYCKRPNLYCFNPLLFLIGSISENKWDKSLLASVLYHIPAGGSTKTILHFAKLVDSGKFHKYNDENQEFPLRNVTVPTILFSSNDDLIATVSGTLKLYFNVANPIDNYIIREKQFTHLDFLFNPDANSLVYEKVVDFLKSTVEDHISNIIESN